MTITLTSSQSAALGQNFRVKTTGVKIERSGDDLLYCSGADPVTLDAEVYTPRGLRVTGLVTGDPANARATVVLDDLDGVVGAAWYAERFSGSVLTITDATLEAGAWVITSTNVLTIATVDRTADGTIAINCTASAGYNSAASLIAGTRANFHLAPEPGESVRIGATTVRM